MKVKERKYQKGITLIALVITIIVLLILAGVTLSIVFNGGIINKSQTAVDKYTEEQAKEKLSLALFEYKMDKVTKKEGTDLQTTLSKLGPVIDAEDTNYYEVEIDGYLFWVHKDKLEIISKGPNNPVPPTKVEFTSTTAEAYIGEGKTFSLNLEPKNANPKFLKWSVNDESVAKIQNGVLTGLKEGTVIVTVTSTEDENITASCTVTIKPIELTGITLNKTSTTIGMGKTEKLEVTYTPENATYKDIVWSTSDDTIATVENGTVTGIKAGTATITATSVKNSSIKAECSVTVQEIIEISTVEELKAFRDDVNKGTKYTGKKVVLVADINLNNEEWTPIGTSSNYFYGTFDGQGHTISGLYINKPTEMYQGLFGNVSGGVLGQEISYIKNIILKDVNIYGGRVTGAICAYASRTNIDKCAVYGNVIGYGDNTAPTGGIVGQASSTNINNCYNFASINVGNESVFIKIGGIAGAINNSKIYNCYNKGVLNGTSYVGGIVGSLDDVTAEIINCYNLVDLSGTQYYSGGIVGYLRGQVKIDNCYNIGNLNGTSTYKGGIVGYIYNDSSNNITINSCSFLTGTATTGIGYTADTNLTVSSKDNLQSDKPVLSVINGENAFVEGENGYPIFNWQDK